MKEIIFYFLKSGFWISVFGAVYWIFFRKETFYKFNRFFLLLGLIVPFLLPFCIYRYTVKLNMIPFTIPETETIMINSDNSGWFVSPWVILLILHFIGALFLLFRHLRGVWKLNRLIVNNGFHLENGTKIVSTSDIRNTFSVLNYIFIDSSSTTSDIERKMIYEHEKAHVDQHHWIDLVIIHSVCVLQWFNPFAWLYLNSIKQNHEFMADQAVLRKGNSPAVYRAALINYTLKTPVFAFTNAFAQYNKFKRIDMMKKETSNPLKKWAALFIFPVLAVFLWVFAEPEYVFAGNSNNGMKRIILNTNVIVNNTVIAETDTLTLNVTDLKKQNKIVYKREKKDERNNDSVKSDSVIVIEYVKKDSFPKTSGKVIGIEPMIIIDGKESKKGIKQISPDKIESISVLKDEFSVRVYGEKGKNGVIIITTKKSKVVNEKNEL